MFYFCTLLQTFDLLLHCLTHSALWVYEIILELKFIFVCEDDDEDSSSCGVSHNQSINHKICRSIYELNIFQFVKDNPHNLEAGHLARESDRSESVSQLDKGWWQLHWGILYPSKDVTAQILLLEQPLDFEWIL